MIYDADELKKYFPNATRIFGTSGDNSGMIIKYPNDYLKIYPANQAGQLEVYIFKGDIFYDREIILDTRLREFAIRYENNIKNTRGF